MMKYFKYVLAVSMSVICATGVMAKDLSPSDFRNNYDDMYKDIVDVDDYKDVSSSEFKNTYSQTQSIHGAKTAGSLDASEFSKSYAYEMKLSAGEIPMADISSTPVHIFIPKAQYETHEDIMKEVLANKQANERLSVKYLTNKKMKNDEEYKECDAKFKKEMEKDGTEDLEEESDDKCKADEDEKSEDETEEEEEEEEEDEDDDTEDEEIKIWEVGTRLSRIKLDSQAEDGDVLGEAMEPIKNGLVGAAEQMDLTDELGKTSYELTTAEQSKVTSAAGTTREEELDAKRRQHAQQDEAIRMMALASVLRNNIASVSKSVDAVRDHYDQSDAKKDLNKKCGVVKRTTDVNQALRQYIYYSLVYDQMLSLEQQIVGLRLQARGGHALQSADVLSDTIKTE